MTTLSLQVFDHVTGDWHTMPQLEVLGFKKGELAIKGTIAHDFGTPICTGKARILRNGKPCKDLEFQAVNLSSDSSFSIATTYIPTRKEAARLAKIVGEQ